MLSNIESTAGADFEVLQASIWAHPFAVSRGLGLHTDVAVYQFTITAHFVVMVFKISRSYCVPPFDRFMPTIGLYAHFHDSAVF